MKKRGLPFDSSYKNMSSKTSAFNYNFIEHKYELLLFCATQLKDTLAYTVYIIAFSMNNFDQRTLYGFFSSTIIACLNLHRSPLWHALIYVIF